MSRPLFSTIFVVILISLTNSLFLKIKSKAKTGPNCPLGKEHYDLTGSQYTECGEEMKFERAGHGRIKFSAQGNNFNVRIGESPPQFSNLNFSYAVVLAGYTDPNTGNGMTSILNNSFLFAQDNCKIMVQNRGDIIYNYDIAFDMDEGSITVQVDGKVLLKCFPPNYKVIAKSSFYYAFICNCAWPSSTRVILSNLVIPVKAEVPVAIPVKAEVPVAIPVKAQVPVAIPVKAEVPVAIPVKAELPVAPSRCHKS